MTDPVAGRPDRAGGPCGCDEAYEHLLEYLDSALAPDSAERIRAHLAECDECSSDVSTSDLVRRLLRRCCVEQAPEQLRVKIVDRLRQGGYESIAITEIQVDAAP
ncbi:hypothetical protein GCM10010401_16240 [Rarobacter faecitabidus]|uniref:Mycothiol system anti-sigma-R factor n=1 Tax=Rarobacter faecitabidus TaxID=13243 RepID=A0A542ZX89_RARFA|nr:mycothiol system anti-sigma-R factor [Rarobacter faecitabidus]TQL64974.1 mycothiol system anti-sigma-R factor [Rarobacter faecitabidus]